MNYTTRKFTAWLLAFIMIFSCMPTNALAAITTVRQENEVIDVSGSVQVAGDFVGTKTETTRAGTISFFSPDSTLPNDAQVVFSGGPVEEPVVKRVNRALSTTTTTVEPVQVRTLGSYDIALTQGGADLDLQGGSVDVTVNLDEYLPYNPGEKLYLIHEPGSLNEDVAATFYTSNNEVRGFTFTATGFSVYAVVAESEENRRLTVNFKNGDSLIDYMIVKKEDTADEIRKIIFDPGAGALQGNELFKGWVTDDNKDNYTSETELLTIDQVKEAVIDQVADINADTSVTYYAAIFKTFNITYVDGGVTVGTETVEIPKWKTEATYTVNQAYSTDDSHNFEGWIVADGQGNIKDYPAGAKIETVDGETVYYYENNTEITLTGNVKFSVDAPEGHWLVFNENGKGATYNAPQFVKAGETTSDANLLEMIRNGYTFDGWYTDAPSATGEDPTGEVFHFGSTIDETTTIYAKWISDTTADYTVLIWKQNVAGDGYDFVEAVTVKDAAVGSTPNAVNAANGRVTGAQYNGEAGFSFKSTDQAQQTVVTEGNTVVNVYWDRIEYTLTFQVYDYTYTVSTNDNDNNPGKYGDVNGQKARVYWRNGAFRTRDSNNGTVYNGTVYTRSNSQSWQNIKTITALYGANIRDDFPIVGSNGVTYAGASWSSYNSNIFDDDAYVSYIDTMQAENTTFRLAYNPQNNYYTYHVKYYVEALPTENNTVSFNGKEFVLYHDAEIHFQSADLYSTETEEFTDITGFTKYGSYPAYSQGQANFDSNRTISLYYTRNLYPINFMDGVYVDGNNNPIEETNRNQLKQVDGLMYGVGLTSYNKDGANYYKPTFAGYEFEGWYIDEACTQAYTFTTMPEGGLTVYAKWRQIQYRVFLHPNAENDPTLDWGSESQAMNFRISYGGQVSVPTGKRNGYEFYGWYTDEGTSHAFTSSMILNDSTVTTPYDKTTHFTDPMNKFGEGATTNADVDR